MSFKWAGGVVLALAIAASGCGGTTFTSDEVVDQVRSATGVYLEAADRKAKTGTKVAVLNTADDDDAAFDKLGAVTIYVLDGADEEFADRLTEDDNGKAIKADAAGIYWNQMQTEGTSSKYWVLTKRYGDNVFLTSIGSEKKVADDRFARIDDALSGLE